MLIDDMLWEQEWYSELPLRLRFLYLYLLTKCSKTGIFEVNLRKATYDINDGQPITRDDIFESFGDRVQPLGESKGIFPDYISWNWMRDKPLDPVKNPLHRGLAQELAKYGLTFASVNAMSSHKKLKWVGGDDPIGDEVTEVVNEARSISKLFSNTQIEEWFDKFWIAYPSNCPRKVDKKKCRDKFILLMRKEKAPDHLFESIMDGLNVWCESDMWKRDDGQYIKAPLVWLNGACWNDKPMKGNGNGNAKSKSANANYQSSDASGIF